MTKTKTAAKTKAAPKTKQAAPVERVKVRIELSGEYDTGSTIWTLAAGKVVELPLKNAERHAKDGRVTIL